MFSMLSHKENANPSQPRQNGYYQETNISYWRGCGVKELLCTVCGNGN
jgi:hypothetical protein